MTYNSDDFKELIPLYLNKKLPEKEQKEFEQALNKYPELEHELKEFSEIKGLYDEIKEGIPQPSDNMYERVITNIKAGSHVSPISKKKGHIAKLQEILRGLYSSPRVSWGVAAVQLVVILLLVFSFTGGNDYRTLTVKDAYQGTGIKINIVFDNEAKEKEIRKALTDVGAIIIDGPSPEGLYKIYIKDHQDMETRLKVLRNTKIVKFAERAY